MFNMPEECWLRHWKSIVVCLLLLAIPLKGFAAVRMLPCGGHADAAYASERLSDHSAHQGSQPDASADQRHAHHDFATNESDEGDHGNCHCSVCSICCAAVGMTTSFGLLTQVLKNSELRPFSVLRHHEGRVPTTLDRPPLAPRSTRVA